MLGKFIVIEGLEGAGKSSAIKVINDTLSKHALTVVNTREPGGTPMAEAIRESVKQDWANETVTVEAELLLMYAARAQVVANVIKPALKKGQWVVGDRHDLSSQAYQGGGRQVGNQLLAPLQKITLKGFKPDLTLYLDVEPEVGLARARGRGELDRIEQAGVDFFHRTRAEYLACVQNDPSILLINAMQPQHQVLADIEAAITRFVAENLN